MPKYIVQCLETLVYEMEFYAKDSDEAIEIAKDNLPNQEDAVDSVFSDFEAVEKE